MRWRLANWGKSWAPRANCNSVSSTPAWTAEWGPEHQAFLLHVQDRGACQTRP
jgi:hypothetical protein